MENLPNAFRFINLGVGGLMVLGGFVHLFPVGLQNVILGSYIIAFGAGTALLEFQIPPWISRYTSFMLSFLGRGVFYFFVGSILLQDSWIRILPGCVIALAGLMYIGLEFIPSIEPPENMRETDWSTDHV